MRHKLKEIGSLTRKQFKAIVSQLGIKKGYKGNPERTICFINIIAIETNEIVTDHLWFTVRKRLKELDLKVGDTVFFEARVGKYTKGYYHNRIDYNLKYPTKWKVIRAERSLEDSEITSATEPSYNEIFNKDDGYIYLI